MGKKNLKNAESATHFETEDPDSEIDDGDMNKTLNKGKAMQKAAKKGDPRRWLSRITMVRPKGLTGIKIRMMPAPMIPMTRPPNWTMKI
jgi:hypothetical protein